MFSKDGLYKKSDLGVNLLGGLEFSKGQIEDGMLAVH